MPTSHAGQINTIIEIITTINPKSILDIGVGHGKYGFLSREYLDIANNTEKYNDRKVLIHGIEAFPEYITDLQRLIYDDIFVGNALEVSDRLTQKYDLILLMDVFEHFTYDDGLKLLKKLIPIGKYILISTPKLVLEQGSEYGNEYETHRFEWKRSHFETFNCAIIPNYYSLIVLLGDDAKSVRSQWKNKLFKVKLATRYPFLTRIHSWLKSK